MSAIVKEVYDTFREAGVNEKKSTGAAKAIADFDTRFATLETDLLKLRADLLVVMVSLPAGSEGIERWGS